MKGEMKRGRESLLDDSSVHVLEGRTMERFHMVLGVSDVVVSAQDCSQRLTVAHGIGPGFGSRGRCMAARGYTKCTQSRMIRPPPRTPGTWTARHTLL